MLAELATQIADPVERLEAVRLALAEAKRHFNAVPATILQDISAVIPMALSGLAARAVFRMVTMGNFPFNLFVSNVPGPQLPLYVAGARVHGRLSRVGDHRRDRRAQRHAVLVRRHRSTSA